MATDPRLAGRVALVTGAARGMGAAISRRFVDEGARVVLGDVSEEALAALAAQLEAIAPGSVHHRLLDVTDADAWRGAVQAARDRFGGLHVLVNNAGITGESLGTPVQDYPDADWDRVLAVNLTGPFLGMRAALGAIHETVTDLRRRHPDATGSVVNISSAQAFRPSPGNAAYAASKWGLRGLTKVVALDAAPLVRVNSVHPGPIDTPMIRPALEADDAILDQLVADVPLARLGTPEDIANLVLFLACEESAYCTGAEFLVEGGRLAGPPRPGG